MAAVSIPAGMVPALVNEYQPITRNAVAGGVIQAGAAITLDANGRAVLAAATGDVIGVALNAATVGYPVTYVERGCIAGFDLSALAYMAKVYTAATGALADTGTVVVGRVVSMPESVAVKVLEVML
jgi:hypothetical protein